MARKKKHPEHVNHERWLVSYADFMTLLFAFFTTLYAISTVDQRKAGKLMFSMMTALNIEFFRSDNPSGGPPRQQDRQPRVVEKMHKPGAPRGEADDKKPTYGRIAGELMVLASQAELKGKVQVRLEGRGVVMSLGEAGFFESGSADLRPDARAALTAIANKLSEWPQLDVLVEGHTDNVPTRGGRWRSNWELSTARAVSVVQYFIEANNFDPIRLSASGYGEYRPVAPNDTVDGRSRNRRIDILVRVTPNTGPQALPEEGPPGFEHPSMEPSEPGATATPHGPAPKGDPDRALPPTAGEAKPQASATAARSLIEHLGVPPAPNRSAAAPAAAGPAGGTASSPGAAPATKAPVAGPTTKPSVAPAAKTSVVPPAKAPAAAPVTATPSSKPPVAEPTAPSTAKSTAPAAPATAPAPAAAPPASANTPNAAKNLPAP